MDGEAESAGVRADRGRAADHLRHRTEPLGDPAWRRPGRLLLLERRERSGGRDGPGGPRRVFRTSGVEPVDRREDRVPEKGGAWNGRLTRGSCARRGRADGGEVGRPTGSAEGCMRRAWTRPAVRGSCARRKGLTESASYVGRGPGRRYAGRVPGGRADGGRGRARQSRTPCSPVSRAVTGRHRAATEGGIEGAPEGADQRSTPARAASWRRARRESA